MAPARRRRDAAAAAAAASSTSTRQRKTREKDAPAVAVAAPEEEEEEEEEAVEWTASVREVFQRAQLEAIEHDQFYRVPRASRQRVGGGAEEHEDEDADGDGDDPSLALALQRLQQIYREDVLLPDGAGVAEEQFSLFLHELWTALARVLVAPRLHATTLRTIAVLVAMFLRRRETEPSMSDATNVGELRSELLSRLVQATKAEDKNVRLRACEMLRIWLHRMDALEYVEKRSSRCDRGGIDSV
ncbi:hypothetical protein PINS_up022590 [Pythium insidiosum]|nr:hypothetical protein PINS_up022590 [Pythium insidiosum]